MFKNIVDGYAEVKGKVTDINDWIDEYNTKCSDKCMPGYVKCAGNNENKCIAACECCSNNDKYCCEGTDNHPYSDINYATGEGEVLYCYDWCCGEDTTRCNENCIPDASGLPYGFGPSTVGEDASGNPVLYPKVCCNGQECCEDGESFIDHLTTKEPFCCIIDEVVNPAEVSEGAAPVCCCSDSSSVCCPNLGEHCQPSSNHLCCEAGYIDCHGECWPAEKPCCDLP